MGHWIAGVVIIACAAASSAAPPSEDKQARARALYDRGTEAFKTRRYDAAADLFKQAYDTFADPNYLYNTAFCFERRGRWRLAIDYYDRFLKVAPGSPFVADAERRRGVAMTSREAEMATVDVSTDPPGAEATVTGLGEPVRCVTPCSARVDPGPVTVDVALGAETAHTTRTVEPSESWVPSLVFKTKQSLGTVLVRVDVLGAKVMLGDRELTTGFAVAWPTGTWPLVATHPKYGKFEADVDIDADRTRIVDIRLRPEHNARGQRLAGWITLGVSGAALVNGAVFASLALSQYLDGKDLASTGSPAVDDARLGELRSAMRTNSIIADVSLATALAGSITGFVLWWTSRSPEERAYDPRDAPAVVRF